MITVDDVNRAYDVLEGAFQALAKIEDKQTDCMNDMQEFKEGSTKAEKTKKRLENIKAELIIAQRNYRQAAMKVDKIRTLLEVQVSAMGRN